LTTNVGIYPLLLKHHGELL